MRQQEKEAGGLSYLFPTIERAISLGHQRHTRPNRLGAAVAAFENPPHVHDPRSNVHFRRGSSSHGGHVSGGGS
jgi:hypothetical protein